MKVRRMAVLVLLSVALSVVLGQTAIRSQIEAALDSWSSRDKTRDAIVKISPDPVRALASVANSKEGSDLRTARAINLLATFKTEESEQALGQLAKDRRAKVRCLALQALTELSPQHAIPVLVGSLNDHGICMTMVSTDPAEEHDVYVSDEAVRLLEEATGQSFDQKSMNGHRATRPWKGWWAKQNGLKR